MLENTQKKKSSETKGDNKGRPAKLRSACPACNCGESVPEKVSYTPVNTKTKFAVCRMGHRFAVGGRSY